MSEEKIEVAASQLWYSEDHGTTYMVVSIEKDNVVILRALDVDGSLGREIVTKLSKVKKMVYQGLRRGRRPSVSEDASAAAQAVQGGKRVPADLAL